ncbi:multidrug transporter [Lysinibacillus fusiformis]|nr:multidrug transporter [Lysinibacillus fusiformis]
MDMDKSKTTEPHLETTLKNKPETNENEVQQIIKGTIDKNKEIIKKNREMLEKYKTTQPH